MRFNTPAEVLAWADKVAREDIRRTVENGIDLNPFCTPGAREDWRRGFENLGPRSYEGPRDFDTMYQRGRAVARILQQELTDMPNHTYPPLKLSQMNCERGAPMGRSALHRTGLTDPMFQVERVPLTDGAYDCGGAYWGSPDNLWLADFTTPRTGTLIVQYFIRANTRASAMEIVTRDYPTAKFLPETGSIIEQTIQHLQQYLTTLTDSEEDGEIYESTEEEIADLEDQLAHARRNSGSQVQG